MVTAAPTNALARALDATAEVVRGIRDDQWSNPTPCPEWNVRTLLNHLVIGNRMFADILTGGELAAPDRLAQLRTVDHLGDDPLQAYRESASALLAAFRQPGVLEGVFRVPAGTVPGSVALHLRITETLVHGWDLAQGTGQPAKFPDDLAQEELAFSQQARVGTERTGHPFGPQQPVADNAPTIDRLAAFLGRPVTGHGTEGDHA